MNFKTILALGAGLFGTAQAFAAPVTIDFEAFDGQYGEVIGNYYSSQGVTFGADAVSLSNNDGLGGYYPNENHSAAAIMFPTSAGNASLNFATGFKSATFSYLANDAAQVGVYDGLNGSGNLVYTFNLVASSAWTEITNLSAFSGVGQSIAFGDGFSVNAGFDDVTLAPVPLPAAAWLLLSGLGGLGAFARRRRQTA
jgi:hypothetical protein